jgi:hypothetical protein
MSTFDHAVKHLLQRDPAGFIRFALDDPSIRILAPSPSVLPSRGRDVDGAYVIAGRGEPASDEPTDSAPTGGAPAAGAPAPGERVVHVELSRRHVGATELGTDIADAQVRLFRREGKRVVTHVWDLYGDPVAPLREKRRLVYGDDGSVCVYRRINLRGMTWKALLVEAPPALWPLVALTRDGAHVAAVEAARKAIEAHPGWSERDRGDHLAVLWFVAEAEGVPGRLLFTVLSMETVMESELYNAIFGDGFAKGEVRGKTGTILTILATRGIPVSNTIRERVLGCKDVATLDAWVRRAVTASTAAAVVRAKTPPRTTAHAPKV